MKKKITITIERQYGSGGRTVGEMLANQLGIHYYNKELLKLASEASGISEDLFTQADENIKEKNPLLTRIMKKVYHGEVIPPESDDFTSMENLFNYQAEVVRKLCESESCVIVGRAADYVLRGYDNVVRVFVCAPHDFLMEQAALKQSLRGKALEKFIEKTDKYKADYYKYYTGGDWLEATNYDLCLDSSKLGFDGTCEAIKAYMKVRFGDNILNEMAKEGES